MTIEVEPASLTDHHRMGPRLGRDALDLAPFEGHRVQVSLGRPVLSAREVDETAVFVDRLELVDLPLPRCEDTDELARAGPDLEVAKAGALRAPDPLAAVRLALERPEVVVEVDVGL